MLHVALLVTCFVCTRLGCGAQASIPLVSGMSNLALALVALALNPATSFHPSNPTPRFPLGNPALAGSQPFSFNVQDAFGDRIPATDMSDDLNNSSTDEL